MKYREYLTNVGLIEGYEPSTELEDISIFKDHAEMLKDLADLHEVSVAAVIDAILDEMYWNDAEWKDHLDI